MSNAVSDCDLDEQRANQTAGHAEAARILIALRSSDGCDYEEVSDNSLNFAVCPPPARWLLCIVHS